MEQFSFDGDGVSGGGEVKRVARKMGKVGGDGFKIAVKPRKATTSVSRGDSQIYGVVGAASAVHQELGGGFPLAVYEAALEREFRLQEVLFERNVEVPIFYRGEALGVRFQASFVCYGKLLVEVRVGGDIDPEDEKKMLRRVKAMGYERGLMLDFGGGELIHRRMLLGAEGEAS